MKRRFSYSFARKNMPYFSKQIKKYLFNEMIKKNLASIHTRGDKKEKNLDSVGSSQEAKKKNPRILRGLLPLYRPLRAWG